MPAEALATIASQLSIEAKHSSVFDEFFPYKKDRKQS